MQSCSLPRLSPTLAIRAHSLDRVWLVGCGIGDSSGCAIDVIILVGVRTNGWSSVELLLLE